MINSLFGVIKIVNCKTEPKANFESGVYSIIDFSMDLDGILQRIPHAPESTDSYLSDHEYVVRLELQNESRKRVMCLELDHDDVPVIGKIMFKPGHAVSRVVDSKNQAWYDFTEDTAYVDIRNIDFVFRLITGLKKHSLNTAFNS